MKSKPIQGSHKTGEKIPELFNIPFKNCEINGTQILGGLQYTEDFPVHYGIYGTTGKTVCRD